MAIDPKLINYPRDISARRNHHKQPGSLTNKVVPNHNFPMPNFIKRLFGR